MPFDLLLTENGDLAFSAVRDLQGISGIGQVNQRIRTRLKVPIGSWVYDEDGTFGSSLSGILNANPDEAQARAEAYVREALRPMEDISIDHVELEYSSSSLTVSVFYRMIGDTDEFFETDLGSFVISIPQGG